MASQPPPSSQEAAKPSADATTQNTEQVTSGGSGSGNGNGGAAAGASGAGAGGAGEEEPGYAPLVDPRLPTRKDTSLREFLSKIDDYAPIVCFVILFGLFCLTRIHSFSLVWKQYTNTLFNQTFVDP